MVLFWEFGNALASAESDCLNGLLPQNDERMNHGSVYYGNLQIC